MKPLRIVIVEDEPATARNLKYMLQEIEPGVQVLETFAGISVATEWLHQKKELCDLIFMDIRLEDGLSFEILNNVKLEVPVIFVTAYNDYALQAFKANGIDYILKPFEETALQQALAKYKMLTGSGTHAGSDVQLKQLAESLKNNIDSYKQSFLVQFRDKLIPLSADTIAWFYTINEVVYAQTPDNKRYPIDFTLEQLQQQLNPQIFFRANRQFLIHRKAITEIAFFFNGRLLVTVQPKPDENILISKARVPEFKTWMNQ